MYVNAADRKRMALLKEPYHEWKKVLQQYRYTRDWMKNGGLILWKAIAICDMSQTSWQMGKRHTRDDLENRSKGQQSFWSSGWVSSDFNARSIKTSSIWQGSVTCYLSWVWAGRGENLERRHSDCGFGRIGKLNASEIYPRRINAKEVLIRQKDDEFIFPVADGTENCQEDPTISENPLEGGKKP